MKPKELSKGIYYLNLGKAGNANRNSSEYTALDFVSGFKLFYSSINNDLFLITKEVENQDSSFVNNLFIKSNFEIRKEKKSPKEQTVFNPNKFESITFFVTHQCNLKCIYCYADSGKKSTSIDPDTAVEFIKKYFIKTAYNRVFFHGGGEPTLNPEFIIRIINEIRKISPNCQFILTSNGMIPESELELLINNNIDITFSADGPPDIQDCQRPMKNGSKSSAALEKTFAHLSRRKKDINALTTISKETCSKQREIVSYFKKKCVNSAKIEPLFKLGRARSTQSSYTNEPDFHEFAQNLLYSIELGQYKNIDVFSSFAKIGWGRNYYCDVSRPSVCMTPEGYISACYCDPNPVDFSSPFVYGKIDKINNSLLIDNDKISKFQKKVSDNMKYCKDCFLKLDCAGQCAYRNLIINKDIMKPDPILCKATKYIGENLLKLIVDKNILNLYPRIYYQSDKPFIETLLCKYPLKEIVYFSDNNFINICNRLIKSDKDFIPESILFKTDSSVCTKEKNENYKKNIQILPYLCLIEKQLDFPLNAKSNLSPCYYCINLFHIKNKGEVYFCDNAKSKRKIDEYYSRIQIFEDWKGKPQLSNMCKFCNKLHNKLCLGTCIIEHNLLTP
ncbi:MAG: radical SAM protein [archaeon]